MGYAMNKITFALGVAAESTCASSAEKYSAMRISESATEPDSHIMESGKTILNALDSVLRELFAESDERRSVLLNSEWNLRQDEPSPAASNARSTYSQLGIRIEDATTGIMPAIDQVDDLFSAFNIAEADFAMKMGRSYLFMQGLLDSDEDGEDAG